ncbi:hypothetical protein PspLS_02900 [Pyricularia sp. CBS 133598]|nr:hypothetical protein PspLS_02900 [Pyricularia sp. CBS 133598]
MYTYENSVKSSAFDDGAGLCDIINDSSGVGPRILFVGLTSRGIPIQILGAYRDSHCNSFELVTLVCKRCGTSRRPQAQ